MVQRFFVWLFFFCLLCAQPVCAETVDTPTSVLLSPSDCILTVRGERDLAGSGALRMFTVLVPPGAENFALRVTGATVVKEEREVCQVLPTSARAKHEARLRERLETIKILQDIVKERKSLWKCLPRKFEAADFDGLDARKKAVLTELFTEEAALKKEEHEIREALSSPAQKQKMGERIRVTVHGASASTIPVTYSYRLRTGGWKARYALRVDPEISRTAIAVVLKADIWQESGFDWENTEITLVTGSPTKRVPPALASWVLEAEERHFERKARMMQEDAAMLPNMPARAAAPSRAEVRVDTSGIYGKWTLPVTRLAEGQATVTILERTWNDPLLWIARPNARKGEVFVMAEHAIPEGEVWPDGNAVFSVSGQTTGSGAFSAKGGKVTLYFGHDPRVSLEVVQDTRKQGESGFLGRDKTWLWAWEYTIRNTHAQAIRVRLERPDPQAVQEAITVTHNDTPKALVDAKKHALYWEFDVPGGGSKTIAHSVQIKAPESLNIHPFAP
ncbi:MAG: DUF4139 domain-containing protein [Desulfovibrionaceae bacterium]|nr:DUF4139 domain-containing protein [Desulfovibrionaceae bacterium]